MNRLRTAFSIILTAALGSPVSGLAQEQPKTETAQKYKLTIIEGASTKKRVKKGRVSSEAVIQVTDENNLPVPGIAVAFTIPHLIGGGAAFANGALTTVATTNAAGLASSSFVASASSSFSISATASLPGGALSTTLPVANGAVVGGAGSATSSADGSGTGAAGGAGAGAGVSTGVIAGIIAGVVVVGAVVAKVATGGKDDPAPTAAPRGTIGSGTGIIFH